MKETIIPLKSQKKIRSTILISRSVIFLIQLCVKFNIEHDVDVFRYKKKAGEKLPLDGAVEWLLGSFMRWDAQHFMQITLHGYTFEHSMAFFPFLPITIRIISSVFHPLTRNVLSDDMLALIVYLVFNLVCFVKTADVLYKLTKEIFGDEFALKSVLVFCLNPASIFFTAPYTESLYCYLTFSAIYHSRRFKIHSQMSDLIKAIIFITISNCVRSNGLLNIGFLCYFYLQIIFQSKINSLMRHFIVLAFSLIACVLPFVYIQHYFHGQFCKDFDNQLPEYITDAAEEGGYVLPGEFSIHNQSWCHYNLIPLPYRYVQYEYWNIGLLRYYQLKQLPNFLQASPVLTIMLKSCQQYLFRNKHFAFHLGILKKISGKDAEMFVFVIHGLFLTIFCLLYVHIQVSTRLIFSATPVIYWFCAKWDEKWIKRYCWGYIILGSFMFSSFMPWT